MTLVPGILLATNPTQNNDDPYLGYRLITAYGRCIFLTAPKPVQKPHPPVFLGGKALNAFKRVVEWGDGWMPNRASVEEIRQGRETLNRLAKEAGRDPSTIQVMAFGMSGQYRDREAIKDLEQAGASRVTIWLDDTEKSGALREIEEIARQVLD